MADLGNDIEIKPLAEFESGGHVMAYFTRGHVNAEEFVRCLTVGHYVVPKPDSIRQTYYRNVPTSGDCGMIVQETDKGRGAYPVTICDSWEDKSVY